MNRHRLIVTRGGVWLYLFLLFFPFPLAAQPLTPADGDGRFLVGRWRASVFGFASEGTFSLLRDVQGFLRLDMARAPDSHSPATSPALEPHDLAALMTWEGEGWCAVQGVPGEGTLGPWREGWRQMGLPLGVWLDLTAAHLFCRSVPDDMLAAYGVRSMSMGNAPQPRPRFRSSGGSRLVSRFLVPSLARPDSSGHFRQADPVGNRSASLRESQLQMARGRGGRGEVLALARVYDQEGLLSYLSLSSSRKPGKVKLTGMADSPVTYRINEVFVPLWPLQDVLSVTPEEFGNPARD